MMYNILTGTPNPRHVAMNRACADAIDACQSVLRPGRTVGDVFDAHAKTLADNGFGHASLAACGYTMGAMYPPTWMDWPMVWAGNPQVLEPGMVFFLHMILLDDATGLSMCIGETAIVTSGECERVNHIRVCRSSTEPPYSPCIGLLVAARSPRALEPATRATPVAVKTIPASVREASVSPKVGPGHRSGGRAGRASDIFGAQSWCSAFAMSVNTTPSRSVGFRRSTVSPSISNRASTSRWWAAAAAARRRCSIWPGAADLPSSGEVEIEGIRTSSLDDDALTRLRRTRIGFVFQFLQLLPPLSAVENVELPLQLAGVRKARDRALEMMALTGAADLADRRPHQLSGGQMQCVAVAPGARARSEPASRRRADGAARHADRGDGVGPAAGGQETARHQHPHGHHTTRRRPSRPTAAWFSATECWSPAHPHLRDCRHPHGGHSIRPGNL